MYQSFHLIEYTVHVSFTEVYRVSEMILTMPAQSHITQKDLVSLELDILWPSHAHSASFNVVPVDSK